MPAARADDRGRRRPGSWGFVQTAPTRYGVARIRLVVLAPGATAHDLLLLRIRDSWVWVVVLTWMLGVMLLMPPIGPAGREWAELAIAGALAAAAAAVVRVAARRAHDGARELQVCTGDWDRSARTLTDARTIRGAVELLRTADALLAAGVIDAVGHELAWTRAWSMLPARPGSRPSERAVTHSRPSAR